VPAHVVLCRLSTKMLPVLISTLGYKGEKWTDCKGRLFPESKPDFDGGAADGFDVRLHRHQLKKNREMAPQAKAWMSWSSGKDSMMALDVVRSEGIVEATAILTTMNADADRVAMHAVRRSLLEAQADRLGLPLVTIEIPAHCSNETYEARMAEAITGARADEITHMIFGDLFLRDVRAYREDHLAGTGISPIFPLWGRPTNLLAHEMLQSGMKAIVTCVDLAQLDGGFAGRRFDAEFLSELPEHVDPCGENGEFHTFVWNGPGFSSPIDIEIGQVVERDGFAFCDVSTISE
jgi:uncharacterized protein (TIGR00290 family)